MNAKSGADISVCDYQAKNTDRNVCATLNAPSPGLLSIIKEVGKV